MNQPTAINAATTFYLIISNTVPIVIFVFVINVGIVTIMIVLMRMRWMNTTTERIKMGEKSFLKEPEKYLKYLIRTWKE